MSIEKLNEAIKELSVVQEGSSTDDWFSTLLKNAPSVKRPAPPKKKTRPYIRWSMPIKKQKAVDKLYSALKRVGKASITEPDHEGRYPSDQVTGVIVFAIGDPMGGKGQKQALSLIKRAGAKVIKHELVTIR